MMEKQQDCKLKQAKVRVECNLGVREKEGVRLGVRLRVRLRVRVGSGEWE